MRYPLDIHGAGGWRCSSTCIRGASAGCAIAPRGRCRCGRRTCRVTAPCWPTTASGSRRPATTRAPRTNRAPRLELEPTSQFAHHTVAHVMEMTGRPEDGLGWMAGARSRSGPRPSISTRRISGGIAHCSISNWADTTRRWRCTTARSALRSGRWPLSLTNAPALLWRLAMLGCDVCGPLEDVGDAYGRATPTAACWCSTTCTRRWPSWDPGRKRWWSARTCRDAQDRGGQR